MLCSSSSSILSFYLIFSHPLISFTNYQDFSDVLVIDIELMSITKVAQKSGSLQLVSELKLRITLALWRDSVEIGLVIP